MTSPRDEVDAAFRHYILTGPVLENWAAWSQLFTDDAVLFDHFYGRFRGPAEIQLYLEATMMYARHCYTALEWYAIDADRVVWQGRNLADHPDPTQPPFSFPTLQVLTYAGQGRWSAEEDWWMVPEMAAFAKGYWKACQAIDPDHPQQMSRRHWGEIAWARPPVDHITRPSWWGREHEIPIVRRLDDMTFGERV